MSKKQVEVAELSGEIDAEIEHMCLHGDIPDFDFIKCEDIRRLMDDYGQVVAGSLAQLVMSVLARHCGQEIINCEGRPVTPLPYRDFGETEDPES